MFKLPLLVAILGCFSITSFAASVPNTFTAGSPASAAQVNANFNALVSAINTLEARLSKIEGKTLLTAAEISGEYHYTGFGNELRANPNSPISEQNWSDTGKLILKNDGTFSLAFANQSSARTEVSFKGVIVSQTVNESWNGTWQFDGKSLTLTEDNQQNVFSIAAGGQIFVGTIYEPSNSDNESDQWVLVFTKIPK